MLEVNKQYQVKNLIDGQRYGGFLAHFGMLKFAKQVVTISGGSHLSNKLFHIKEDLEGYEWTEEMFENKEKNNETLI